MPDLRLWDSLEKIAGRQFNMPEVENARDELFQYFVEDSEIIGFVTDEKGEELKEAGKDEGIFYGSLETTESLIQHFEIALDADEIVSALLDNGAKGVEDLIGKVIKNAKEMILRDLGSTVYYRTDKDELMDLAYSRLDIENPKAKKPDPVAIIPPPIDVIKAANAPDTRRRGRPKGSKNKPKE